eukprot:3608044-Rhodomonas_salina.1
MDQGKVSGIGNYILSEALYRSMTDPFARVQLYSETKRNMLKSAAKWTTLLKASSKTTRGFKSAAKITALSAQYQHARPQFCGSVLSATQGSLTAHCSLLTAHCFQVGELDSEQWVRLYHAIVDVMTESYRCLHLISTFHGGIKCEKTPFQYSLDQAGVGGGPRLFICGTKCYGVGGGLSALSVRGAKWYSTACRSQGVTRLTEVTAATCLRACYAISGTDIPYGAANLGREGEKRRFREPVRSASILDRFASLFGGIAFIYRRIASILPPFKTNLLLFLGETRVQRLGTSVCSCRSWMVVRVCGTEPLVRGCARCAILRHAGVQLQVYGQERDPSGRGVIRETGPHKRTIWSGPGPPSAVSETTAV